MGQCRPVNVRRLGGCRVNSDADLVDHSLGVRQLGRDERVQNSRVEFERFDVRRQTIVEVNAKARHLGFVEIGADFQILLGFRK